MGDVFKLLQPKQTPLTQSQAVIAQPYSQPKRTPLTQPIVFLPSSLTVPNTGKIGGITIQALIGRDGRGRCYGGLSITVGMGTPSSPSSLSLCLMWEDFGRKISPNENSGFEWEGILSFLGHVLQKKLSMECPS